LAKVAPTKTDPYVLARKMQIALGLDRDVPKPPEDPKPCEMYVQVQDISADDL